MAIDLVKDAYDIARYGYNLDINKEVVAKLIQPRDGFIKTTEDLPAIDRKGFLTKDFVRKYVNYQTDEDEYVKYGSRGVERLIYKNKKPFGAITFTKNYSNGTFLSEVFECGKNNELYRIFQDGTRRLLLGLGKFSDCFDLKDFRALIKEAGNNVVKFL